MKNNTTIQQQTRELITGLKAKYQHPYLFSVISQPTFDEERVQLFIYLLKGQHTNYKKYLESALLMELALNTHEQVITNGPSLKERQLTVLAGDYLSGLYYKSVALLGDTPFLLRLSKAIRNVNESKIKLKLSEANSMKELLTIQSIIDDSMLVHVLQHFHLNDEIKIVSEGLIIKRLEVELENWKKRIITPFLLNLQAIAKKDKTESVLSLLENELDDRQIQFQTIVKKYWSASQEIVEYFRQQRKEQYLAEEG
ncbi:heptaprenyl diphosphate synthase component 1 [Mangrovibacillus cuniculi]|uniref:Heptaprenyl diphosphate synthase component 1 n=1 Tax=Mangrovibacillus cuniculi TaxID=2593652 RepID=A0A7S8HFN4_9BACI|nr:heptaprenyl diphosphate synthase component 1 [Mangrovibacillus cuniculi]QPC46701.1 heptaprenyl diphosphate synthase component 1 [Mangrovibacillus cuniculi]